MLSVIYIAIQITSIWLASIFGFAGVESKTAWEHTHKFSSGEPWKTECRASAWKLPPMPITN